MGQVFGQLLKRQRESMGVSGYRICQVSGVQSANYFAIEKGRRSPSQANLEALASVSDLGVTIEQLQAWADLDKLGPDGLARLRHHMPELFDRNAEMNDQADQGQQPVEPPEILTLRERRVLEKLDLLDNPSHELHPLSRSAVWQLTQANRWRLFEQIEREHDAGGIQVIDDNKLLPDGPDRPTPRERKLLEKIGAWSDPSHPLHPDNPAAYVWSLPKEERWRALKQELAQWEEEQGSHGTGLGG